MRAHSDIGALCSGKLIRQSARRAKPGKPKPEARFVCNLCDTLLTETRLNQILKARKNARRPRQQLD